jgi:hypothetical protein
MRIGSRLLRLERLRATIASGDFCAVCGLGPVQQIAIYELGPDGIERLVSGKPPVPCPKCGRIGRPGAINRIVVHVPAVHVPARGGVTDDSVTATAAKAGEETPGKEPEALACVC